MSNLWIDKHGEPLGDRPDSVMADAPFWKAHWMTVILWWAFIVAQALVYAASRK